MHLRTYATDQTNTEALDDFEAVLKIETENETGFTVRINNKAYRCGSVHRDDENINSYINGLLTALKTIVQRFQNATPCL